MPKVENVPAAEWRQWVDANQAVVLDIREPHEWRQGTLPGAVLIPMGELPTRLDDLDPGRPMLVVCRSGSRSHQVALYLSMMGHGRVANMAGGMKALGLQT